MAECKTCVGTGIDPLSSVGGVCKACRGIDQLTPLQQFVKTAVLTRAWVGAPRVKDVCEFNWLPPDTVYFADPYYDDTAPIEGVARFRIDECRWYYVGVNQRGSGAWHGYTLAFGDGFRGWLAKKRWAVVVGDEPEEGVELALEVVPDGSEHDFTCLDKGGPHGE